MSTSPVTLWYTYRNASVVPQMSAPAPETVNVPFANDALPAIPVDPTTAVAHGDGTTGAAVTVTLSKVVVFRPAGSWLLERRPRFPAEAIAVVVGPTTAHVDPFDDT